MEENRQGFLGILDAAINYFDPNKGDKQSAKDILDKQNETHKLEIKRLTQEKEDLHAQLKALEKEKISMQSECAFSIQKSKLNEAVTTT